MRKNYLAFCCRPPGPLARRERRELGPKAQPCPSRGTHLTLWVDDGKTDPCSYVAGNSVQL